MIAFYPVEHFYKWLQTNRLLCILSIYLFITDITFSRRLVTFLACVTFATATTNINLLATVLLYSDGKSYKLVASGQVPPSVDLSIKNAITKQVNSAAVKVVSMFKTPDNLPSPDNLLKYIMAGSFTPIYTAKLPERVAYKIVRDNQIHTNVSSPKQGGFSNTVGSPVRKYSFRALYTIENKCENFEGECGQMPERIYHLPTISAQRLLKKIQTSTTPYVPSTNQITYINGVRLSCVKLYIRLNANV